MIRKVTTNYCRHHNQWRERKLKELNNKRNRVLRLYGKDPLNLKVLLPPIQQEITKLQEEKLNNDRLRSGNRWMEEKNENSPGYTKKTIKQRLDNKYMSTLKYPATSTD